MFDRWCWEEESNPHAPKKSALVISSFTFRARVTGQINSVVGSAISIYVLRPLHVNTIQAESVFQGRLDYLV